MCHIYTGEVIDEEFADKRGVAYGDEYLFTLDAYGRSRGCQRLHDLGLKNSQQQDRKEYYLPMKVAMLKEDDSVTSLTADKNNKTSTNNKISSSVSKDTNVFKVPLFVSYASKNELEAVLGTNLVASIMKSTSVTVNAKTQEVQLVGNLAIQRQYLKGHATALSSTSTFNAHSSNPSSSSTGEVAPNKRKKVIKKEGFDASYLFTTEHKGKKSKLNATSNLHVKESNDSVKCSKPSVPQYRVYSSERDEVNMIKRSRLLAQKEAR